ncbi:MAG TPA: cytochrome c oxidase subunit II [Burkholderiaceae bacterium]|nr:cytochrome c oxidase subunit II [Burkholderiaceae bacterium]
MRQHALSPAGPQAAQIHELWWVFIAICGVVFVALLVVLLWALWRAPRSDERTAADVSSLRQSEPGLQRAVIAATAASIVGLIALTTASVVADRALARLPGDDAVQIELTANQWWWEARYMDPQPSRIFTTANELHVPVGRTVVVTLRSNDVIHSFWVPNLHGKKDLIPGHTTSFRFRADEPGIYRGQCAEFCGFQHARMGILVIAEPAAQYEAWAEQQRQPAPEPADPLASRGRDVFVSSTCAMCHRIQGTAAHGRNAPDLTHLASRRTLAAGTLPNTTGHLAGWIVDPQRIKPGVNMPQNTLAPDDLQALLAYLGTLK